MIATRFKITETDSSSLVLMHTGGTPWFIRINEEDHIVFADFHIDTGVAIQYLQGQLK
jgi:hypothetical protein